MAVNASQDTWFPRDLLHHSLRPAAALAPTAVPRCACSTDLPGCSDESGAGPANGSNSFCDFKRVQVSRLQDRHIKVLSRLSHWPCSCAWTPLAIQGPRAPDDRAHAPNEPQWLPVLRVWRSDPPFHSWWLLLFMLLIWQIMEYGWVSSCCFFFVWIHSIILKIHIGEELECIAPAMVKNCGNCGLFGWQNLQFLGLRSHNCSGQGTEVLIQPIFRLKQHICRSQKRGKLIANWLHNCWESKQPHPKSSTASSSSSSSSSSSFSTVKGFITHPCNPKGPLSRSSSEMSKDKSKKNSWQLRTPPAMEETKWLMFRTYLSTAYTTCFKWMSKADVKTCGLDLQGPFFSHYQDLATFPPQKMCVPGARRFDNRTSKGSLRKWAPENCPAPNLSTFWSAI